MFRPSSEIQITTFYTHGLQPESDKSSTTQLAVHERTRVYVLFIE